MASLVDTNVLVYYVDVRFPEKREQARDLIRSGVADRSLRIAHQCLVEFVSAVIRPRPVTGPILTLTEAHREVEEYLDAFDVLYPTALTIETAFYAAATFRISWYDAHLWAYAQTNNIDEIISEDFGSGHRYGHIRVRNPFA